MGQKRRRFTAGFKARVALEALKELDTVQGIAQRNGLSERLAAVRAGGREPLVAVLHSGGRERGEPGTDEADGRAAHGASVLRRAAAVRGHHVHSCEVRLFPPCGGDGLGDEARAVLAAVEHDGCRVLPGGARWAHARERVPRGARQPGERASLPPPGTRPGCPAPIIAGHRSLPDSHHARKLYFQRAFIHQSTPYSALEPSKEWGAPHRFVPKGVDE